MTKKLFILTLIGLISATSSYAKCDGGTMIGNFCKSNVQMNWWSAAAWCKANDLHLATMYEICPNWDGNTGYDKCLEATGIGGAGYVWSATANGELYVFTVDMSWGTVRNTNFRHRAGDNATAICLQFFF